MEVPEDDGWHQHFARFGGDGFSWFRASVHMLEHAQWTLVKTKVAHGGRDLAVLDQECAVSCHACQREVRWIDGSDVPEIRHKDRPLALLDQFLCLECRRPGRGQARGFQRRDALDSLLFGGESV